MSSPEVIILEQFYDELKDRGIKVGNKVKHKNGDIETIIAIEPYSDYPIELSDFSSFTINGKHKIGDDNDYWDIVDWNYKEPEDIAPKQKVTIEKWLIKDVDRGEHFIIGTSDIELNLKDFPAWKKVKLIKSYEVEL